MLVVFKYLFHIKCGSLKIILIEFYFEEILFNIKESFIYYYIIYTNFIKIYFCSPK